MNNFVEILMNVAGTIFDRTSMISSFFTDEVCLTVAGCIPNKQASKGKTREITATISDKEIV